MKRGAFGLSVALMSLAAVSIAAAGEQGIRGPDAKFVTVGEPTFAIAHVGLLDGTGAPPQQDMTVIVREGRIAHVAPAAAANVPAGLTVIDGKGKTLLPGFVLMHEHLFYPTLQPGKFGLYPHTFTQLSLAGGATTIRTAGALDPQADRAAQDDIRAGRTIGADTDVTGPYINGATRIVDRMPIIKTPQDATDLVDYWSRQGATAFKAYQTITRDELAAAVKAAHAHGAKIAAHLCSVTAEDASALGVDSLEHGFAVFSDFTPNKKDDICPPWIEGQRALARLSVDSPEIQGLIGTLIKRGTAITSTLGVAGVANAPQHYRTSDEALSLLSPELRTVYEQWVARNGRNVADPALVAQNLEKVAKAHLSFLRRGGLLMTGTDPTIAGVIPGYADLTEYKLMVGFGFTPAEAILVMTLNGARYLGQDREIGSVTEGKRADLVLVNGDLAADATTIDRIETVFKAGIGYSRARLLAAYKGKIGYTDSYAYGPEEN
ncbi:enamidase [Nitrospirillum viridazoti]|uniref:Enamidase n=2 Tax=Nitrospirillum TaxID=1543705 RepID=A0A560HVJ3_9PROT|nr:enamidase [Nitrospirillum amazonense]